MPTSRSIPPVRTLAAIVLTLLGAMPLMAQPAQTRPHTNRLARSSSPYLLQHAHNPVDWFEWGEEAFAEARRRGVPLFVSVGYSTCYWCHVMERESFEDEAIAAQMNEQFVCVKVDREERPDVDALTMAAAQILTRGGGWPTSVFLTPPGARGAEDPGLEPFYAGTYFPPAPAHGRASFPQVLSAIHDAWANQREMALAQAARVGEAVRDHLRGEAEPVRLSREQVDETIDTLLRAHDGVEGGFGAAPKFPQVVYLEFIGDALLRMNDSAKATALGKAFRLTLDRMAVGGLFDQVGGGFHRYCVDGTWTVPHFEKMLYDQAQLAAIYARSHAFTRDAFEARVTRRTLDYVLREMTSPEGAFWSAQDAEVDGREGANYVWSAEEFGAALGPDDARFAAEVYGVAGGPNFRDPHHADAAPSSVLRLEARPDDLARRMGLTEAEFLSRLDAINARLYGVRAGRKQPRLDDKVIASWNGMMIAAFAQAGAALGEARFTEAGARAAAFVLTAMDDGAGGLRRTWRGGEARLDGLLEDYAHLAQGLIALHRAGVSEVAGRSTLGETTRLMDEARERFGDGAAGGWFDTTEGRRDLIVRARSTYDGATPSPSSVMLHNCLDLYEITRDEKWKTEAARGLAAVSRAVAESPTGTINSTRALLRLLTLDEGAIGRAGMTAEVKRRTPEEMVEIFADAASVTVPRSGEALITLELRIAPGLHVNAHTPGVRGLVGLEVEVTGGRGVRAAVDYPRGEAYTGGAVDESLGGPLMVHTGVVRLPVRLSRAPGEAWAGAPRLMVTWQACDDAACYEPAAMVLEVAIEGG